MHFNRLKINGWRQFSKIDLNIQNQITIITGENGCGKTTVLNILATHNNWSYTPLASPKEEKNGVWGFISNLTTRIFEPIVGPKGPVQNRFEIGEIEYSDNAVSKIYIPDTCGPQYGLEIPNKQPIPLLYIPSHRPIFKYQKIDNIPTNKKSTQQASEEVANSTRERYFGIHHGGPNQSHLMKNTLIGWAINGYGVRNDNQYIMPPDREQISNFEGFQDILHKLLPTTVGFNKIEIRNMEIVLVCNDGLDDFMLESVSGGIGAIIDIAWQIFMFSRNQNGSYCVIIDEIENHLHPKMQRRILLDLIKAFPSAKFIISTHSPLIVNSANEANIYVLIQEGKKFSSKLLDLKTSALEANEILENVLGVSSTLSINTEANLQKILDKFKGKEVSENMLNELRSELAKIGMERTLVKHVQEFIK